MVLVLGLTLLTFSFSYATSSYELGGVISGNRMGSVPLGISLGDGELDVEGVCTRPGMACQNCTHAITCIALPVGWLKVPLNECSNDETCNARHGGCTTDAIAECDIGQDYDHKCEQVGIFPDANDCRKFHMCSPPVEAPMGRPADHRVALCPRHYAYNPYTAQCSIKLPFGQCETKPVPECTKIGQSDVLADSPNHYYVCLSKNGEIGPQIFICPHGWFFWDGYCRPEPRISKKNENDGVEVIRNKEEANEPSVQATEAAQSTVGTSTVPARITEYPPDTFLADKFDLTNYETLDYTPYVRQGSYEFGSSSVESF